MTISQPINLGSFEIVTGSATQIATALNTLPLDYVRSITVMDRDTTGSVTSVIIGKTMTSRNTVSTYP